MRNLLAHKVRLLLTLISVVLGTAFVAGSFVFTDTLQHSFNTIFADARTRASTPACSPRRTTTSACRLSLVTADHRRSPACRPSRPR